MRIHPIKSTIPLKFKLELHEPRTHEPTSDVLDVFRIFRGLVKQRNMHFQKNQVKSHHSFFITANILFSAGHPLSRAFA
jgi:hypothetical protein